MIAGKSPPSLRDRVRGGWQSAGVGAIPTAYRGYTFRSRLEARWAVFFDALGLAWEYEREGYRDGTTWYLPDFWLPSLELFWEVKGTVNDAHSGIEKAKMLSSVTGYPVAIAYGPVGPPPIATITPEGAVVSGPNGLCGRCQSGGAASPILIRGEAFVFQPKFLSMPMYAAMLAGGDVFWWWLNLYHSPRLCEAYMAARTKSFWEPS